jgi:RNA polymerase sigma-70 factor (ECF subfamily)
MAESFAPHVLVPSRGGNAMTAYSAPYQFGGNPDSPWAGADVLAARAALRNGLTVIRSSMRGMLTEATDGLLNESTRSGVPRTRNRPHPNEAPPRHVPGGNSKPLEGRLANPAKAASHVAVDEPIDATSDTIPIQTTGASGRGSTPPARPDPSDAASEVWNLIERAQAGDGAAFGLLYDRYFDTVFRFVYFRVGNRQLAEDLTSDTFLRALKRIGSFTWQGRDLGAWLVTIARNLVADHFKSGRYRLEVTTGDVLDADRPDRGPEGSPEAAVIDHITNVDLLKAVKQLNPEQQECIVLRFLHGFSVAETAQAMGKNEGAIKALQYRAVRALARLLPEGFQS